MITYLQLIEALKKSIVYRDGKKKLLKKTDKEGYKTVDGKEVKMSSKERKNRSISSKKAAKKKKGQQSKISKLRAKTMKKRG